jgi:hypothetical protein
MYTIVSAVMRRNTTSDEIYAEFMQKRSDLARKGWKPYGDVMYYVNAVGQAMTFGTPDMSDLPRMSSLGSTTPRVLEFCYGSEGTFGKYVNILGQD